jgi:hypothetical protein
LGCGEVVVLHVKHCFLAEEKAELVHAEMQDDGLAEYVMWHVAVPC